jgi:hypothetical protein
MPQSTYVKAALFDVEPALAVDVWMENAYSQWSPSMVNIRPC